MTAKIFHPLLALIASVSNNELAKYVEFLKEENKILRARIPGQVHTKPDERSRLIKLGKALGQAIEELITLVAPTTFYRWCREADSGKKKPNPKGGQRKSREIREFVIEIAKTTGFGYTRIIGELRKVGIKGISRQTVRNILKEEGIVPGPDRTSDCWDNFVKRHAETLWAVDFFSVKTVTTKGLRDMYLLAFLCLSSREVIVTSSTEHSNSAWVVEQTKEFLDQTMTREQNRRLLTDLIADPFDFACVYRRRWRYDLPAIGLGIQTGVGSCGSLFAFVSHRADEVVTFMGSLAV